MSCPRWRAVIALATMALLLACCSHKPPKTWYVLIDVSASYAEQVPEAVRAVRFLLNRTEPGDRITVARIDSASFSRDSIIARERLPDRPSSANEAKQRIAAKLERFSDALQPSQHTDIRGAIANAARTLDDASGSSHLVLFSDLDEAIDASLERSELPALDGVHVLAVNVAPTQADNRDPEAFRKRLQAWDERFRAAGAASWKVLATPELADAVYDD